MIDRLFTFKAAIAVVCAGLVGAFVSKGINQGAIGWYWAILTAVLSGAVWGWMARQRGMSLIYSSILYDVVYAVTYVLALAAFGEGMTWVQAVGVGLAILGTVLTGWA